MRTPKVLPETGAELAKAIFDNTGNYHPPHSNYEFLLPAPDTDRMTDVGTLIARQRVERMEAI